MTKKKILFLGETYRADAITWMNGLKEFGDFDIVTWELKTPNTSFFSRLIRIFEFSLAIFSIRKIIQQHQPDMVIAERTTSYGFLAALSGVKPIAIAQQGRTDIWPEKSILLAFKKIIQHYAFKKADLIHAWGSVMTISMKATNVDMKKVLVLPKGIDLIQFKYINTANPSKINAIVTRSLAPDYRHEVILKAFGILNQKGIDFTLTIVGDGKQLPILKALSKKLQIETKVNFTGRIQNTKLPELLQNSNIYLSMPITEGVSASLFEAMASNCYPIVTDIPGNQSWIKHRENGQLITIDDYKMLADEIIWAFENNQYRKEAKIKNRKFVEENADYKINMKIIAEKYHELINTQKTN
ncbi:glycosyltransferase [Flavobacterium cellulosilyticum]|uniref:Glycosyltransferase n=1 Tax=Flavobacterium cellulosilyticum TaxID=2541731 RepID=A0A4R5CDJ1_9FLAO|nr:glycosyltransferase [Flavobacterium cellulosilyticum]TDD95222.1 glycosyltransferase [Flavobacterium cellulosilyticum]